VLLSALACALALVCFAQTGCSRKSAPENQAANSAAPNTPPAAAPAAPEGERKSARATKRGNDKKDDEQPAVVKQAAGAPPAAEPKPAAADKTPDKWTMDDLKAALAKKDPRYAIAVQMQGAMSHGDGQKGQQLGELLAEVAKMPGGPATAAPGAGNPASRGVRLSGRGSKSKQEREESELKNAAGNNPAAQPPAAAAPAQPPAQPPPAVSPDAFKGRTFNFGRNRD